MLKVQNILVPTDFSDHSESAFHLACALARDYGGRLVVLHVMPAVAVAPAASVELLSLSVGEIRQATERQLHEIRPSDPATPVEHRLEEGDPATAILKVAQEMHADLIVLGTHGRTGLTRLLMGSIAEHVIRNAGCPVLTVKNPIPESVETDDP